MLAIVFARVQAPRQRAPSRRSRHSKETTRTISSTSTSSSAR
jgi:hypothetical protein